MSITPATPINQTAQDPAPLTGRLSPPPPDPAVQLHSQLTRLHHGQLPIHVMLLLLLLIQVVQRELLS